MLLKTEIRNEFGRHHRPNAIKLPLQQKENEDLRFKPRDARDQRRAVTKYGKISDIQCLYDIWMDEHIGTLMMIIREPVTGTG
jgi:hypothetical protein